MYYQYLVCNKNESYFELDTNDNSNQDFTLSFYLRVTKFDDSGNALEMFRLSNPDFS